MFFEETAEVSAAVHLCGLESEALALAVLAAAGTEPGWPAPDVFAYNAAAAACERRGKWVEPDSPLSRE